jgi:putative oxidoreductase
MQRNDGGGSMEDFGKLILRVTLAVLILFHGVSKIFGGIGPITGMVAKTGLPEQLGYLVYVGEVLAPLLILIGAWTRLAALVIVINISVAVLLVHTAQFFTRNETGGWALELQAMYFFTALALAFLGAGRYSAGGRNGRWN